MWNEIYRELINSVGRNCNHEEWKFSHFFLCFPSLTSKYSFHELGLMYLISFLLSELELREVEL